MSVMLDMWLLTGHLTILPPNWLLFSFPLTNHMHQEHLVVIHSYLTGYIKSSEPYPMERQCNTFTLHTTHNLVLPSLCKGIQPIFCKGGGCLKFSNSASVAVANSKIGNSAWVRIHLLVSNLHIYFGGDHKDPDWAYWDILKMQTQ